MPMVNFTRVPTFLMSHLDVLDSFRTLDLQHFQDVDLFWRRLGGL